MSKNWKAPSRGMRLRAKEACDKRKSTPSPADDESALRLDLIRSLRLRVEEPARLRLLALVDDLARAQELRGEPLNELRALLGGDAGA
jgi:hypothetical protein